MRGRVWLATALVIGAGFAIPATSAAQAPTQDSVLGTGEWQGFGVFTFDARSGPSGENPAGRVDLGTVFGGPVTCLTVRDNTATVNTDTSGGILTYQVTDNAGTGSPDVISAGYIGRTATDCSPAVGFVTGPISSGNITITDATPFPTSKEQCKDGGWRQYGSFKNQGDCVSFVATGGKNPPAGP